MSAMPKLTQVLSRLTDPDLVALDAWRRAQHNPPSRNRAVELLVRSALRDFDFNWTITKANEEATQHVR
jgi:hypothetical protein